MKIVKNPNPEAFASISEAVKANDGYCPCLRVKNEDTKCMCKDFRDSTESDFCHCGRYYKIEEYDWIALVGETTTPESEANFSHWIDMLEKQNFIVIPVKFNQYNTFCFTDAYENITRAKIADADAVLFLDEEDASYALDIEVWAEALSKKIIRLGDLK